MSPPTCKPTPEQIDAWKRELTRNFEKKLKDFPELLERTINSYLSDPEVFEGEGRELREACKIDKDGYANYGIDIIGAEDPRYKAVTERLDALAREHVSGGPGPKDATELNDAIAGDASCSVTDEGNLESTSNNVDAVPGDDQGASSG
jgi:hypothetical protein